MNTAQPIFRAETRYSASYNWAGYALGFGMAGLFDGILLHQILQWRHWLSGIQSGYLGEARAQVMADGLFQAVMYFIVLTGLYLLYRARADLSLPRGGRRLTANFWIGFGLWHVLDAVLANWIAGIHQVRMGVADAWAWDLGWLVVFGLVPLVAGWRLRRIRRAPPASLTGRTGIPL